MARLCPHILHLPLLLLLLIFSLLPPTSEGKEGEGETDAVTVSVQEPLVSLEEGHGMVIACSKSNDTGEQLLWSFQSGRTFQEVPSDRIWANFTTGDLTITDARVNDSGVYTCRLSLSSSNATVELHVYAMPTYEEEGLIIGAICAGLLVVLAVGLLIQHRFRRKKEREYKARLQKKAEKRAERSKQPPQTSTQ